MRPSPARPSAPAPARLSSSQSPGVFTGVVSERRKERTIENLDGHCIICGHGRMGLDRVKGPDGVIETGEVIVGAGTNEELRRLEELADAG